MVKIVWTELSIETARQLANLGNHVIIAARNETRMKQVVEKLKAEHPCGWQLKPRRN